MGEILSFKNNLTFKAILTTIGRKTGKEHSVWAKAVTYNNMIYFSRRNPNSDWLKNAMGNDMISFSLIDGIGKHDELIDRIKQIEFVNQVIKEQDKITIKSSQCSEVIPKIFQATSELNVDIDSLSLNKPTLDDVFISYTGRNLRDDTTQKLNKRKEFNLNRRRGI